MSQFGQLIAPRGALESLLSNMPPGIMQSIAARQAAPVPSQAPGAEELAQAQARRDRIQGAMEAAQSGFNAGLAATPRTGPQPSAAAPPQPAQMGSVEGSAVGGMTGGAFPQRVTPEMARMHNGGGAFPMSPGYRGGFPRYGNGSY